MSNTISMPADLSPAEALQTIKSRVLADGYQFIIDPTRSRGARIYDATSDRHYLDFYGFFAAQPVGYNHPRLLAPDFQQRLLAAATTKVANPDMYTGWFADFVKTFDQVAGLPRFEHFFFIDGGALAVENALKTAFDWKVRRNLAAGRGEIGHQVIHFRQAFHGRSGYTLSLTNTHDRRKTMYFPIFDWPRVDNPAIDFSLPPERRDADVAAREQAAIKQIEDAIRQRGAHHVAALIIEPIQGEGGDNHFRPAFFFRLRELCDQHDIILIFDEVQTGIGITGRIWCCEHFGVMPDIIAFGKKVQICGIMAGPRIDEEPQNVFRVSTRINSTFGGNIADMVRSAEYLRIIRDENLCERAAETGAHLGELLERLARDLPAVTAPRGRGLMRAFDLPKQEFRDAVRKAALERGLLVLGCGSRSIRFRPVLDIPTADVDAGVAILRDAIIAVSSNA